jgi:hypothetical protein
MREKMLIIGILFFGGALLLWSPKKPHPKTSLSTLDVRMVFGYKDARPARFVTDRYEQELFSQQILRPCTGRRQDCGFKRKDSKSLDGEEVFERTIESSDGVKRLVLLSVIHSSVGPDDLSNRTDPFQKWQSEKARAFFLKGLALADVVFYNGHSRSGGGPDFAPPLLDSRGHVNYTQYKHDQNGLADLQTALKASSKLSVLGLFSCDSDQLFSQPIASSKKDVKLISSHKLLYFAEAIQDSLDALSSLLEMSNLKVAQRPRPAEVAPRSTGVLGAG